MLKVTKETKEAGKMFDDFEAKQSRSTGLLLHRTKQATKETRSNGAKMIEARQRSLDKFSKIEQTKGIPRGGFRLEVLKNREIIKTKILKIGRAELLVLGKIVLEGLIEESPASSFQLVATDSGGGKILMPAKLRFEVSKQANVSNERADRLARL